MALYASTSFSNLTAQLAGEVELVGGGACAKDSLDFRMGEERGNVVWHNVFDACVACSDDGAAVENVPKGDVVL